MLIEHLWTQSHLKLRELLLQVLLQDELHFQRLTYLLLVVILDLVLRKLDFFAFLFLTIVNLCLLILISILKAFAFFVTFWFDLTWLIVKDVILL